MKGSSVRNGVLIVVIVVCALVAGAALAPTASAVQQAQWTFAIYMCSDNDLDEWGALNVEWLKTAPSSDEVNFLVLWDTSTGPVKLLKVSHGEVTELSDFGLHGTEVNMGDPATLVALVDYIDTGFPAGHVALTLWDHGDDFTGICYDYDTGTGAELDSLSHQEIGAALAGRHVDIVGGDGCGIGAIETAYEYVAQGVSADWFVASETYVPLDGFPYDRIAADLVADPAMTPEHLSKDMVERYAEYYQSGWLTELSAIRLSALPAMTDELWDVTAILSSNMRAYRGLVAAGKAKATMGWSQYGWEGFVDLPMVFKVVYRRAPGGSALRAETAELLTAIEEAAPYVGMGTPGAVWDFGGVSVFFPGAAGSYAHNTFWRGSLYPTMQFAQDGWLDFLRAYFGGSKRSVTSAARSTS
jgi:hypothetical protein